MIYCLVVTYNVHCGDSLTCRCLKAQENADLQVIVYDNSEKDFGNEAYCIEQGWRYLGGKGNKGLSVAYNEVIDALKRENAQGFLCLLDDDTALEDGYFRKLGAEIEADASVEIFLPIMKQNGKVISPCHKGQRNRLFAAEAECFNTPVSEIQAINSGMTVNLDIFRRYRYDERLFLDCVDHAFLRDMKKQNRKIKVIPVYGEQSFSGGEKGSYEGALARFRIFSRDARMYFEASPLQYWFVAGKRGLHLTLMYHRFTFLKLLFQREKR